MKYETAVSSKKTNRRVTVNLFDLMALNKPGFRLGGYPFTTPRRWSFPLLMPPGGGIYVVLDADSKPLYIGECNSFTDRLTIRHEKLAWCRREAKGSDLYVALHGMFGTSEERKSRECELIRLYDPPCNIQETPNLFNATPTLGSLRLIQNLAGLSPAPAPQRKTISIGDLMAALGVSRRGE
jgi:hypothetical protein